MVRRREAGAALAVTAAALGADFATGRELAAFYAQTAGACWLGALSGALTFGLLTALVARLARDSGAENLFSLLCRTPGGTLGRIGCVSYAGILLLAGGSLIAATGRLGALALPLRRAEAFGIAAALLLTGWLALGGAGGLRRAGALFVGLLMLCELLLLGFARLERLPGMPFVVELRLANAPWAALALGAAHAILCACLSSGVALRAARTGARPAALGLYSGAAFLALVLAGTAALRAQPDELLVLEAPFVALASQWGSAGFWCSAGLVYLAAVTSLAGLLAGLIPPKWMLNSKISRKSD